MPGLAPSCCERPKAFPFVPLAWGMAAAPPCPLGGECRARDVCHCSPQGQGAALGARRTGGGPSSEAPGLLRAGRATPRHLVSQGLLPLDRPRGCADTYTEARAEPGASPARWGAQPVPGRTLWACRRRLRPPDGTRRPSRKCEQDKKVSPGQQQRAVGSGARSRGPGAARSARGEKALHAGPPRPGRRVGSEPRAGHMVREASE